MKNSTTQTLKTDLEELNQARDWLHKGFGVVLATVIKTWGSSPRPVGSHLVINQQGDFVGSVSGGCIEGAVVQEAFEVLESGQSRQVEFGVSTEQAWEVGLSCGGGIDILLQPLHRDSPLMAASDYLRRGERVASVTDTNGVVRGIFHPDSAAADKVSAIGVDDLLPEPVAAILAQGRSGYVAGSKADYFVRSYQPRSRLVLIGAVHISQYLAPMAELAGFAVTVIDPRPAFATEQRFRGVRLMQEWPDEALAGLQLDSATAVVTLTHDPKLDDPAIVQALNSPVFYIGSLGSKRTHQQRLERLAALGLEAQVQRICAPVGLDLGGRAPEEIAVAVLAQIVQARYRRAALRPAASDTVA